MSNLSQFMTLNVSRLKSVCEQLTIVSSGNVANLDFNSGSGNIAYVASPSGTISLNISNIPTTDFDNKSLTFSVIVNQSATAYACNSITLNGVTRTIRWPGAIVATGNANSIDVFNFIGINTVGSGSTTTNYTIFANVNGGYR